MIVNEQLARHGNATLLDIGCGAGFDNNVEIQKKLARVSRRFIGVEPDFSIAVGPHVTELHRCTFEEADIDPCSIDIAYAVMVLEHLRDPGRFWDKLWQALKYGGVFGGFTMDRRHFFCWVSQATELVGVKDRLLQRLRGERGSGRYENYPTYYRANSPPSIRRQTRQFRKSSFFSFGRVGQLDYYTPRPIRPLMHMLDRAFIRGDLPGGVLAVRVEK